MTEHRQDGLTPAAAGDIEEIRPYASAPSKSEILNFFKNDHNSIPHHMPRYWAAMKHYDFTHPELTEILQSFSEDHNQYMEMFSVKDYIQHESFFPVWFDKFYALEEFSPHHLVKNQASFSDIYVMPESHFRDIFNQEINFDGLAPKELTNFIASSARLGMPVEDETLKSWVKAVGLKINDFEDKRLVLSAWALAVLSASYGHTETRDVARILLDHVDMSNPNGLSSSQINTIGHWFEFPEYTARLPPFDGRRSRWEVSLCKAFERAGNYIFSQDEHFIPALQRSVDIRMMSNDRHIIGEADGPRHFIRNLDHEEETFNGSTRFQTALLGKLNPDAVIVRVDYKDHKELRNIFKSSALDIMATELTEQFKTAKAGMYTTDFAEGTIRLKPFFDHDASMRFTEPVEAPPLKSPLWQKIEKVFKWLPFPGLSR